MNIWCENISTHTSRVGCDDNGFLLHSTDYSFLLTHPVWDVTSRSALLSGAKNFYSHIPCGMWHLLQTKSCVPFSFLLTHPVWDVTKHNLSISTNIWFLLTHPVWDVTSRSALLSGAKNFYSHIPCGMWHLLQTKSCVPFSFLLTHPVWDVTRLLRPILPQTRISTHTSRVGCDLICNVLIGCAWHFYSHIPCGMWRFNHVRLEVMIKFLLTHPVWDVTYRWSMWVLW